MLKHETAVFELSDDDVENNLLDKSNLTESDTYIKWISSLNKITHDIILKKADRRVGVVKPLCWSLVMIFISFVFLIISSVVFIYSYETPDSSKKELYDMFNRLNKYMVLFTCIPSGMFIFISFPIFYVIGNILIFYTAVDAKCSYVIESFEKVVFSDRYMEDSKFKKKYREQYMKAIEFLIRYY
jgi:hypothetical protein